jgi:hypothetical protein
MGTISKRMALRREQREMLVRNNWENQVIGKE